MPIDGPAGLNAGHGPAQPARGPSARDEIVRHSPACLVSTRQSVSWAFSR